MNRIRPIDGWRAIAALGVLWTHTWATTGFKSIIIGRVDLFKAINIVGNGVHLFFIISGFCMYLVFRKIKNISFATFLLFIKKRWIRIAPAFYFACIVIALYNFVFFNESLFQRLGYNFVFLQNIISNSVISAPFWSLAVEWHFYVLLPLIFILTRQLGFLKGIVSIAVFAFLLNAAHNANFIMAGVNWWYFLPGNIIHFLWGIVLCYCLTENIKLPLWLGKAIALLPALFIASLGKGLFSKYAIEKSGQFDWIVLSIGPPMMTAGFCWLVYISLVNGSVGKIIGNKFFSALGKISYSFYLWHEFILQRVFAYLNQFLHFGGLNTILLFIASVIVLLPVSYLSFIVFEKFYFSREKIPEASDVYIRKEW